MGPPLSWRSQLTLTCLESTVLFGGTSVSSGWGGGSPRCTLKLDRRAEEPGAPFSTVVQRSRTFRAVVSGTKSIMRAPIDSP